MDLKKLEELLKEWCDAEIQSQGFKDLKSSIAETAKEKLNLSASEFNHKAKLYYMKKYDQEKFDKIKDKSEDIDLIEGFFE